MPLGERALETAALGDVALALRDGLPAEELAHRAGPLERSGCQNVMLMVVCPGTGSPPAERAGRKR